MEAFRRNGRGGSLDPPRRDDVTAYDPYGAKEAHRFQISLVLWATRGWIEGEAQRKQLILITSGVSGTVKSFVIRVLTGAMRTLHGNREDSQVYAPTGVSAFQLGGHPSHRLLRPQPGQKHTGN